MSHSKDISTLVEDIYGLLGSGHTPSEEALDQMCESIKHHVKNALAKPKKEENGLRASRIGERCDRRSWYDVNANDLAEPIDGQTLLKFLSGHIFEHLVLFLTRESGHSVKGTQKEIDINGVKGHNDAIIDGVLVDVKTTSSYGINKFVNNGLHGDDAFNYLDQIEFYKEGLQDDEELVDKDRYAFLAISREQCRIELDIYPGDRKTAGQTRAAVEHKQEVVLRPEPPNRAFPPVESGSSGNLRLSVNCRYCPFKRECWKDSNDGNGLRTFRYSGGKEEYLTRVVKKPLVEEVI